MAITGKQSCENQGRVARVVLRRGIVAPLEKQLLGFLVERRDSYLRHV